MYEAAGGIGGLRRLAQAWHARVMADEEVSHAFSHGYRPDHSERLAAYWAEALGGPPMYSDAYGDETSVVRIHSGNGAHEEMDRRAIACFDQALADTGLADTGLADTGLAATSGSGRCCTTTSPGRPPRRWPATTGPRTTCRTACASRAGPGTGASRTRSELAHQRFPSRVTWVTIRSG